MSMHPADVIVPTHEVFEYRHILALPHDVTTPEKRASAHKQLLDTIDKNSMATFYRDCCGFFGWEPDQALLNKYDTQNSTKLDELNKALEDAKNQYGDVEVKDAKLQKAHHFCLIGDWTNALEAYEDCLKEKAIESGGKIDIFLTFVRIGLFTDNIELTRTNLKRAETQFELGGDWERRNRMRIYKAIHIAKNERKFAKAAELMLSGLATFTASELLTFHHFVTLAVLLSLCGLPRPVLKAKVANSPEVLQVFGEDKVLETFFTSFMNCGYQDFFRSYEAVCDKVRCDQFLRQHYRFFVRSMRLIAYRQYLEPFKSVTLPAMAQAFGVSEEFIENEIVSFISSGKLHCKVDKIAKTIQGDNTDSRNDLYEEVVRSGDALINGVQMLSRVIDL